LSGRCSIRKKIDNHTWLERDGDGKIVLRLHATDILVFEPRIVTLNSGGWRSVTTKARMNKYLEWGRRVYSERGEWVVLVGRGENRVTYKFEDGMKLVDVDYGSTVQVEGAEEWVKGGKVGKLKKRVFRYVKGYLDALEKGEVAPPGLGDCFYCQMRVVKEKGEEKGKTLGQATKNTEHLDSHMEEWYYVGSLLSRVMEEMSFSECGKWYVHGGWKMNDPNHLVLETTSGKRLMEAGRMCRDQVERAMRRWMVRQYGYQA
jgi:hypothetical protein